jgi:cysteine-rich repeat protein
LSDETCGNATTDYSEGELCDDANALSHDGCSSCQPELAAWTLAPIPTVPAGGAFSIAYDARRGKVVRFGQTLGLDYNFTLEWDGTAWTNVTPSLGNPSVRRRAAMTYDVARGRIVMFGGADSSGKRDDTWEWDGVRCLSTHQRPIGTSPTSTSTCTCATSDTRIDTEE